MLTRNKDAYAHAIKNKIASKWSETSTFKIMLYTELVVGYKDARTKSGCLIVYFCPSGKAIDERKLLTESLLLAVLAG